MLQISYGKYNPVIGDGKHTLEKFEYNYVLVHDSTNGVMYALAETEADYKKPVAKYNDDYTIYDAGDCPDDIEEEDDDFDHDSYED